ncbi:hypothetical protein NM688_g5750 [Phlebia brevispora]|uniref:Uncharacterized protein n=1 Tax=Phlebia brevispora TaxID=194682 RepID=A0ACC1SQA1_9APHY|nr:hypothetical protein NM688_g5750 [Phlebia brevispora]
MVRSRSPPPFSERLYGLSPARARWREERSSRRDASPSSSLRKDREENGVGEERQGGSRRRSMFVGAPLVKKSTGHGHVVLVPAVPGSTEQLSRGRTLDVRSVSYSRANEPSISKRRTEGQATVKSGPSSGKPSKPRVPQRDLASQLVNTLNQAFGHDTEQPHPRKRRRVSENRSVPVETSDKDEQELQLADEQALASISVAQKSRVQRNTSSRHLDNWLLAGPLRTGTRAVPLQRKSSSLWLTSQDIWRDEQGQPLVRGKRYVAGTSPKSSPAQVAGRTRPRTVAPISSYGARFVPTPAVKNTKDTQRDDTQKPKRKLVPITAYAYSPAHALSGLSASTSVRRVGPPVHAKSRLAAAQSADESISSIESAGASQFRTNGVKKQVEQPTTKQVTSSNVGTVRLNGQPIGPPKRSSANKAVVASGSQRTSDVHASRVAHSRGDKSGATKASSAPSAFLAGKPVGPPRRARPPPATTSSREVEEEAASSVETDYSAPPRKSTQPAPSAVKPVVELATNGQSARAANSKGKQKAIVADLQVEEPRRVGPPRGRPKTSADATHKTNGDASKVADVVPKPAPRPDAPQPPAPTKTGRPRGRPRKNPHPTTMQIVVEYAAATGSTASPSKAARLTEQSMTASNDRARTSDGSTPADTSASKNRKPSIPNVRPQNGVHTSQPPTMPMNNSVESNDNRASSNESFSGAAYMRDTGWYLDPVTFQWKRREPSNVSATLSVATPTTGIIPSLEPQVTGTMQAPTKPTNGLPLQAKRDPTNAAAPSEKAQNVESTTLPTTRKALNKGAQGDITQATYFVPLNDANGNADGIVGTFRISSEDPAQMSQTRTVTPGPSLSESNRKKPGRPRGSTSVRKTSVVPPSAEVQQTSANGLHPPENSAPSKIPIPPLPRKTTAKRGPKPLQTPTISSNPQPAVLIHVKAPTVQAQQAPADSSRPPENSVPINTPAPPLLRKTTSVPGSKPPQTASAALPPTASTARPGQPIGQSSADTAISRQVPVTNSHPVLPNHTEFPPLEFQRREYLCFALVQLLQSASSTSGPPRFSGYFTELADPNVNAERFLYEVAEDIARRSGVVSTDVGTAYNSRKDIAEKTHMMTWNYMYPGKGLQGTIGVAVCELPNLYRGARGVTVTATDLGFRAVTGFARWRRSHLEQRKWGYCPILARTKMIKMRQIWRGILASKTAVDRGQLVGLNARLSVSHPPVSLYKPFHIVYIPQASLSSQPPPAPPSADKARSCSTHLHTYLLSLPPYYPLEHKLIVAVCATLLHASALTWPPLASLSSLSSLSVRFHHSRTPKQPHRRQYTPSPRGSSSSMADKRTENSFRSLDCRAVPGRAISTSRGLPHHSSSIPSVRLLFLYLRIEHATTIGQAPSQHLLFLADASEDAAPSVPSPSESCILSWSFQTYEMGDAGYLGLATRPYKTAR